MYVHKSISNHWLFKDVIIHYLIKRLQARKSNHANVLTLQVLSSHQREIWKIIKLCQLNNGSIFIPAKKKKNPKFENRYDYAKLEKLFDLKTG